MNQKITKWGIFINCLRAIEIVAVIIGALVVITVPYQIKDFQNTYNKNHFDILWQLDTRLREGKNHQIFLSIDHNKSIYRNGITEDDLDLYLSDLYSIYTAYKKQLISKEELNDWFYYNIKETMNNKEVKNYIDKLRKEDDNEGDYQGLDEIIKDLGE